MDQSSDLAIDPNSFKRSREYTWSRGAHDMPSMPRVGATVVFSSLALNILSVGLPVVVLQTYDRVVPNAALDTLAMLILGLVVVLILESVLRQGRNYLTAWTAARFEHSAGCRAVDRLLSANIREFEKEPPGVHLDRLIATETLRDFYSGQAKLLALDLPFVVIFLGLIFVIGGSLVLVPLVMLALLIVGSLVIGRKLRQVLFQRALLDDRRYSFILEVLGAIHTIKSLGFETAMQRRYERLQDSGAGLTYRITFLSNMSQSVGQVFTFATMVAVVTFGATLVMAGGLSIGSLAASTLLSGRTIQPLLRALSFWTQFQNIVVARERANALFDTAPEARPDAGPSDRLLGGVELRNVSFKYDEGGAPILENANLEVRPGETIGIKGEMGCGKSTLLMLLMRILEPTEGRILHDGIDLSGRDPFSLRAQIAYMPQSAVLFHGTILENLTMFNTTELESRALEVTRTLGIDQTINRLPAGFETKVGASAENELSIGLRQSIAMARALVTGTRLVLFDEANAALDTRTDEKLKDSLAAMKGETTMVLVSHRPSLLALADRIYLLENGRLIEQPPIARAGDPANAGAVTALAAGGGAPPVARPSMTPAGSV